MQGPLQSPSPPQELSTPKTLPPRHSPHCGRLRLGHFMRLMLIFQGGFGSVGKDIALVLVWCCQALRLCVSMRLRGGQGGGVCFGFRSGLMAPEGGQLGW